MPSICCSCVLLAAASMTRASRVQCGACPARFFFHMFPMLFGAVWLTVIVALRHSLCDPLFLCFVFAWISHTSQTETNQIFVYQPLIWLMLNVALSLCFARFHPTEAQLHLSLWCFVASWQTHQTARQKDQTDRLVRLVLLQCYYYQTCNLSPKQIGLDRPQAANYCMTYL